MVKSDLARDVISLDELLLLPDNIPFSELVLGGQSYAIVPEIDKKTGIETYHVFQRLEGTELFYKITQYQTGIRYS